VGILCTVEADWGLRGGSSSDKPEAGRRAMEIQATRRGVLVLGGSVQNSKFHLSSLISSPLASILCTLPLSPSPITGMSRVFSHNQKETGGNSSNTSLS